MLHALFTTGRLGRQLICRKTLILVAVLVLSMGKHLHAQQYPSPGSDEAVKDSLILKRYVRQALDSNPRLAGLFELYYAQLEQIPQVGTLPDPEVMFQYHINPMNYSPPFSRTSISAMQMFPWFGTLGKRKEYVEKLAGVEWAAFQEARNEVVRQVKSHWYRMHELHHHLMIYRHSLALLHRLEQQIQTLYESGRVSQVDLLRIQIEQESLNTQIENSVEKLAAMKVRFNTLLNRKPDAPVEIPDVMFSTQPEVNEAGIRRIINDQNPELRGLRYKEEAAHAAEEQARLEGYPSFGLGLMVMNRNYMYMSLMEGDQAAWSGSLTIRLPLYRSKYKARQREARMEARAVQQERQDKTNSLTARAEEHFQQYRDARRRIALYEQHLIPKTRQALNIALTEYSSNRSDFEQLIQLYQQLLEYEMKLNTAYVDQNMTVAEMEYLYGRYNTIPEETGN